VGRKADSPFNQRFRRQVGARIWALRTVKEMSGTDFGKAVGATHGAVSKWENGHEFPTVTAVAQMCVKYHVDFNYIFGGTFDCFKGEMAATLLPLIAQKFAETEGKA
jgi:transcriptional regulator with XRE-family HTH domain